MANKTTKLRVLRYPWDKWFKRKSFELYQGIDFDCMVHSMVAQIRTAAAARGKRVSIQVEGHMITVTIR